MSSSKALHLRRLLLLRLSSPIINTIFSSRSLSPLSHLQPQQHLCHHPIFFSYSTSPNQSNPTIKPSIAQSISTQLIHVNSTIPLNQRLDLHFSQINPTPDLIREVFNQSGNAGRNVLGFHQWVSSKKGFAHNDETYSYLVHFLGKRHDFKLIHEVLVGGKGVIGEKTMASMIYRLVRAGRETKAVEFFEKMEREYGFVRNKDSLKLIVATLCDHGFASHAEKMVNGLAHEFFPDEAICDLLVKGWCVDGKLDEAKRLAGEIYRGGFELGPMAYNSILDCVCKLCRKKNPFLLQSEAEKVLLDMDVAGVPRNVETFNVLITNLCKIRKTEEALNLFERMAEWGCSPDSTTYLVLIRSLFQAARIGEGDEMIERMKSAGFGEFLNVNEYYGFLKVLCGIERIDHAMKVFSKMKEDDCMPRVKTYDLLVGKLYAHGRPQQANTLLNEATERGVPCEPKVYKLDPRFAKKPKVEKSGKPMRETLPEKTARKNKRLQKIRLSFVKKPQKNMRRAY
ncbi:hypothetical protein GIB67_032816 [Kingdonia uniflora]|uniref:Pentatricopeptide repeat-containing protein PNM1, mitochondrial n=1 Tax=Kingdonia uniflora TaxID=39325 RepID=A0A7J7NCK8_9MAGN|nr:hypothetical protein GIB67_032816 [Kingdonia uniflora]